MTNEYFLHPIGDGLCARVPFPPDLPLTQRDAYMAAPPAEALAAAECVPAPVDAWVAVPGSPADIVIDHSASVAILQAAVDAAHAAILED